MSQLKLDAKGVASILNSRKPITRAEVGEQVVLTVQGNGNYVTAEQQREADKAAGRPEAKQYFDKYIYNLKATTFDPSKDVEEKKIFTEGMKMESAGNMEEAEKLYNQFLNATQLSFNVIDNGDSTRKFNDGEAVTAWVELVKGRDGNDVLAVRDVRLKPAKIINRSVKFDITDLVVE